MLIDVFIAYLNEKIALGVKDVALKKILIKEYSNSFRSKKENLRKPFLWFCMS